VEVAPAKVAMHPSCHRTSYKSVIVALFALALLVGSACGSPGSTPVGPAAPTVPPTPVPVPTSSPTPVPTPTPELKLFRLQNVRQEVGCGFGCAWYYSADRVTRTNDPLVSTVPLASGDEFAIVQINVEAKGQAAKIAP